MKSDATSSGAQADAPWAAFESARNAADFGRSWLALQCLQIAGVRAALLLLEQERGHFIPAAVWPSDQTDASHLVAPARLCLSERRGKVLRDQPGAAVVVAYPVQVEGQARAAVVLDLAERPGAPIRAVLRQLQWGVGWLEALRLRRQHVDDAQQVQRVRTALEVLAVAAEQPRLQRMAMAVVNDLAARLGCGRVALGVQRGGRAHLLALSHSAAFDKKSEVVASLEAAMDEALDQRRSVVHPPLASTADGVCLSHRNLAGSGAACSVVLFSRGVGVGVLTFERTTPFDAADVQAFETLGSLLGPLLDDRLTLHRWWAGRAADQASSAWHHLRDPRRPGLRVALAASAVLLLAPFVIETDYRVGARAVLEGEVQRAAAAPFDGFLHEAPVRAGFTVRKGQMLARLDDRDLLVERQRWLTERAQHESRYRDAMARHERATAGVALAETQQAEAQLTLVEDKLARASILAPFDGIVVSGDLSQLLGSPIERGKVLFEIAPLDAYRVILKVEDRDIRDVRSGQSGSLVLAGLAARALDFEVANVSTAEADNGMNVFRVEARLERSDLKLRPGMEGVAKVNAGQRSHAWLWTHRMVDWLRLQAWTWLP